jgi:hypothetical protein
MSTRKRFHYGQIVSIKNRKTDEAFKAKVLSVLKDGLLFFRGDNEYIHVTYDLWFINPLSV